MDVVVKQNVAGDHPIRQCELIAHAGRQFTRIEFADGRAVWHTDEPLMSHEQDLLEYQYQRICNE